MGKLKFYFRKLNSIIFHKLFSLIFISFINSLYCSENNYPFTSNNIQEITFDQFKTLLIQNNLITDISLNIDKSQINIAYTDAYCEKYKMCTNLLLSKYWKKNEQIIFSTKKQVNNIQLYNQERINTQHCSQKIHFNYLLKHKPVSVLNLNNIHNQLQNTNVHYNIATINISSNGKVSVLIEKHKSQAYFTKIYIQYDCLFCPINNHITVRDIDDMYACDR